jgi:hypothetical protein
MISKKDKESTADIPDINQIKDELYTFASHEERTMLITISTFDETHSTLLFESLYKSKKNDFYLKKRCKIDQIKEKEWDSQFKIESSADCCRAWNEIASIFRYKDTPLGVIYDNAVDARGAGLMYRFHQNTLPFISRALKYYKKYITNEKNISYLVKFPEVAEPEEEVEDPEEEDEDPEEEDEDPEEVEGVEGVEGVDKGVVTVYQAP